MSAIAGGAYSLVSGVLVSPLSQVLLALIMGWMFGLYYEDRKRDHPGRSINKITIFIIVLAVLIGFYQGIAPDIPTLTQNEKAYNITHNLVNYAPRFWIQGRV